MQSLQVELVLRLDGHETHVLALHRLGNRFRIAVVVLVRLHERSHKLRRNQSYLVPLSRWARPRKCDPTPASIPINDEGRLAVYNHSLLTRKLLSHYDLETAAQCD